MAVSVADEHGVRGKVAEPTAKEGRNDALALQIIRLVGQSCVAAGVDVAAISAVGVASCGPFVINRGMVELAAPNICGGMAGKARGLPNDWHTALLEAPLRAAFPNVRVENDGVGALEAERRWGALKGMDHCAYVTWSTGIGMGLCVDGHILRGKNGNAGHVGHTFVSDNDDALRLWHRRWRPGGWQRHTAAFRFFGLYRCCTLFVAAHAGDPRAGVIIDDLCRVMGRTLFNMIATLDLQRISMGGSVFWHHRDFLLPKVISHVQGKLGALTDGVEIVPAGLGDRVGDYAALALVA